MVQASASTLSGTILSRAACENAEINKLKTAISEMMYFNGVP
jgi:hypothetical protein